MTRIISVVCLCLCMIITYVKGDIFAGSVMVGDQTLPAKLSTANHCEPFQYYFQVIQSERIGVDQIMIMKNGQPQIIDDAVERGNILEITLCKPITLNTQETQKIRFLLS